MAEKGESFQGKPLFGSKLGGEMETPASLRLSANLSSATGFFVTPHIGY
jgi:hypothetical protein